MKVIRENKRLEAAPVLKQGGVAVILTDTLYGIVAVAENESACQRIRDIKGRDADKAMIILAASTDQLWGSAKQELAERIRQAVGAVPTSIIAPASSSTPSWLPKPDDETIAFRIPKDETLQRLLRSTGPLVAPSANPQGLPPATTIEEAIEYFGDTVDLYVDGGSTAGRSASRLVRFDGDGSVEFLR